ncbi:ABC transporter substrate-binding protein [Serpentinicella sp. ANB-PHB4]|uniref:ABC transporter substrate-binding protein n=1 Tax=Serpentinicella sp. ANB-PHB4 TaxID=3074076 RepID=UPI00285D23B9|nr:ABC transporter substrate-binding protein [Serpentinicella sp. ANB-PHB4]MDR5658950.1 ABC transporter substrate-binding protein [Serpentinicella sp. ANB-PHB4]
MVEKRKMVIKLLCFMIIGVLMIGCGSDTDNDLTSVTVEDQIKIGISQIIEHPALDSARQGFIDGLASQGYNEGEQIDIDFQSAQGDISIAQSIAQNFVSQNKDMIFAIATPSAQTAFQATNDIPILITAVTDPVKAGIVNSWEKSGTNVTGTSDNIDSIKHFNLLKTLAPETKKVGILYNTGETNSEVQVAQAKEAAADFDLEIITASVSDINDVNQSLDFLLDRVDALYTIQDNVVASSMPLIANSANQKNIPIIAADKAHVDAGALATKGIDYYQLGFETALMAIEVINGELPSEMGIKKSNELDIVINLDTADEIQLDISDDVKASATLIRDGVKVEDE